MTVPFRRAATMDDLQDVLALAQAADVAVIGETDWIEADLREEWQAYDLERDVFLLELGRRLAGYAAFESRGGGRMLVDGYVHPELTGRGVGGELLRLTEARARAELDSIDESERAYLHNATLVAMPGIETLYAKHGYHPERHFWRMLIELETAPAVSLPAGIEIRLYREPDERRLLHEVLEEAFLDHWESRPRRYEEWSKQIFEVEGYDPTLVWVATDGDEIAGASVCYRRRHGDWGWVGTLGVRWGWRRRGIAEALLATAFRELFRRGERRVALGVDAQSPTGATRLYEKAGMRVFWEAIVYEKELRRARV